MRMNIVSGLIAALLFAGPAAAQGWQASERVAGRLKQLAKLLGREIDIR